jgi:ribosome maturation factor RimP
MPGGSRPAASPVDDRRLAGLIWPVVAAAGMDLESVRVTVAGRRRLLRVVVDSDHGVSLDDAAFVSREVSAALDAADAMGDVPYTLEVSSPGVDRPLTEPRHWRRAAGRLVRVRAGADGTVQGRVLAADAEGITMDVSGVRRRFSYGDLGPGAVQVEFGRVADAELQDLSGELQDLSGELQDLSGDGGFPGDEDGGLSGGEDGGLSGGERGGGLSDTELPCEADLGAGGDGH